MLRSKSDVLVKLSGAPIIDDHSGLRLSATLAKPPTSIEFAAGGDGYVLVSNDFGPAKVSLAFGSKQQFWRVGAPAGTGLLEVCAGTRDSACFVETTLASSWWQGSISRARQGFSCWVMGHVGHTLVQKFLVQSQPPMLGCALGFPYSNCNLYGAVECWPLSTAVALVVDWGATTLRLQRSTRWSLGLSHSRGAWRVDADIADNERRTVLVSRQFDKCTTGISISFNGKKVQLGGRLEF